MPQSHGMSDDDLAVYRFTGILISCVEWSVLGVYIFTLIAKHAFNLKLIYTHIQAVVLSNNKPDYQHFLFITLFTCKMLLTYSNNSLHFSATVFIHVRLCYIWK